MVLRVCQRVLHHAQDAEDAFQATFIVLMRKARHIAKSELLANWLYGVAYRTALNAKKRRPGWREQTFLEESSPARADLMGSELQDELDEALQRLPAKYQAPIVLCYLEGKTNEEATRLLGCPLSTLQMRLVRARELLRSRLARRGVALAAAALAALLAGEASAAALVPAALADRITRAAVLVVTGTELAAAGVTANVAALADSTVTALSWARTKLAAAVTMTVVMIGLGVGWAAKTWQSAPPEATVPAAPEETVPVGTKTAVSGPWTSSRVFASWQNGSSHPHTHGNYHAASGTGPAGFQCEHYLPGGRRVGFGNRTISTWTHMDWLYSTSTDETFTVKIVKSTATYQQLYLTTKGTMYEWTNAGDHNVFHTPFVPVQLQISITLGAEPASLPPNYPAGWKVATMSFTALNAEGRQVFASELMTGNWK
jgi:RNA polymerase sigma factor (sigma-70 family)